jgi:hypothetical protein
MNCILSRAGAFPAEEKEEVFRVGMVWIGTLIDPAEYEKAEEFLTEALDCTYMVKIRDQCKTPSGRNDVLFTIQSEDVPRVAITRFRMDDIKWVCDVISQDVWPSSFVERNKKWIY